MNLEKAMKLAPEDPLFPYLLGRIYEEVNDDLKSRTAYLNVLRLDSTLEKLLGNPEFEKLKSKGIEESAQRLRSLVTGPDSSRSGSPDGR
ncbi:hypothetical protein IIC65_03765 [Candidatus Sumerlaeota bacterium]|nr:hypothetical protein [Candidatus Sumerlaeota bacterium]